MATTLAVGDPVVFSDSYLKALHNDSSRDAVKGWTGVVTETNAWVEVDDGKQITHPATTAVVTWTHPVPDEMPIDHETGKPMRREDYTPAQETSGWNVRDLAKA